MDTQQNIETEELLQRIVERQAELIIMSSNILKNKTPKQSNINYKWFETVKDKNAFLKLSKAV